MKKLFEEPIFEVEKFEAVDVITTSDPNSPSDPGNEETDQRARF